MNGYVMNVIQLLLSHSLDEMANKIGACYSTVYFHVP
jgi:hypothetical protein